MGIGAAISGIAGGILSSNAAGDAADAQTEAAELQVDLQRDIYNETVDRFEPFLNLGTDYSNALRYELLGGEVPIMGATDYEIKEVRTPTGGRVPGQAGNATGHSLQDLIFGNWNRDEDGNLLRGAGSRPQQYATQYTVGGHTFDSRGDAEYWVSQNSGGTPYRGFQATPGYQFALDQGQAAIDNSAAARGNVFSGATLKAQQEFGTGLANQEYNNYLNRLTGQASQGQAAAGNMATAGANYGAGAGTAYANMGNAQAAGYIGQANAINSGINNAIGAFGYMNNGGNMLTASNGIQVPGNLMNSVGSLF